MLERIFGHWKTSLAGILLATATVAGVLSQQGVTLGNAGTGTVVGLIAALAVALLGLVAKDPGKLSVILLVICLGAVTAQAQQLSTQATASAFHYQGNWLVGTEQTQSFPLAYFGQQKGNVFSLGAREIIVPGSFNAYTALGNYQPDLSKLIAKTTFSPDQFSLSFDLAGGLATLADNTTKPTIEGRVNFAYALSPNVALTGAYAGGGMIGKDRFVVVSAGLQYMFGAQHSPSAAVQRLVRRAALKRAAAQAASSNLLNCATFEGKTAIPCSFLAASR